jgi:hypothetical protein
MRAKADINKPVGQVRSHFESQPGFAFACRLLGSIPSFGMVTLESLLGGAGLWADRVAALRVKTPAAT